LQDSKKLCFKWSDDFQHGFELCKTACSNTTVSGASDAKFVEQSHEYMFERYDFTWMWELTLDQSTWTYDLAYGWDAV